MIWKSKYLLDFVSIIQYSINTMKTKAGSVKKYVVEYRDESLIFGSVNTELFILTRNQIEKDVAKGLRPLSIHELGGKKSVSLFVKS